MKKIIPFFILSAVAGCLTLQSCNDSKTYAEQLEDERKAIDNYIAENEIKTISFDEFKAQDYTTNTEQNEYVRLSDGVYLQIVDKGEVGSDSIKNGNVVTVRFLEYNIQEKDTTAASNWDVPDALDVFDYRKSGTTLSGTFRESTMGAISYMYYYYSSTQVPEGWLVPLEYLRSQNAHIKIIVPSKAGHSTAMSNVTPYFYDMKRIKVWD
jgi:hypothetical protein